MGEIVVVSADRFRTGPASRDRRPMTPATVVDRRPTYTAPFARPDHTRPEAWQVVSDDGLWSFERVDNHDADTPWLCRYLPTGDATAPVYGTQHAARRATHSGQVYAGLRAAALRAALDTTTTGPAADLTRCAGQASLSVYLREQAQAAGEPFVGLTRCGCGGLIDQIPTPAGTRWVHVDVCGDCLNDAGGLLDVDPHPHRTCPDPAPADCAHTGCPGDRRVQPDTAINYCADGAALCCRCCWREN